MLIKHVTFSVQVNWSSREQVRTSLKNENGNITRSWVSKLSTLLPKVPNWLTTNQWHRLKNTFELNKSIYYSSTC